MAEHTYPVTWTGRRAVLVLPDRIDASNAGQISEAVLLWKMVPRPRSPSGG